MGVVVSELMSVADHHRGCYVGTDSPLTDSLGFPLCPRGRIMSASLSNRSGFTYFIQHETGGLIKIGTSSNPEVRLRNINTDSHDPRYRILTSEPGGKGREIELHIRFRHLRAHGEWFRPDPELLDYIGGLA